MSSLAELIIYESQEKIIKAIKTGAFDLNKIDNYGFSPLIQAIICKKPKVLAALLRNGANIEQTDSLGRTALHWAANRAEIDYCEFLLKKGANPNHFSLDGQPILVTPILREQLELVELFKQYNTDYLFAEDFISTKLLGHRYELSGEADIASTDGKFIPLKFEGFYLEFTTSLIRRSLYNFINSIPGQKFSKYEGKLSKILHAMKNAAQLTEYSRHKDKSQFMPAIDSILDSELLLIPSAYKGHAITFIKYKNLWAKCDRGVNNLADTVVISEIGNPYILNKDYYKKLLYGLKTEDFILKQIKQDLALTNIRTLPTESQMSGNCSWANVETSVPAMMFMLSYNPEYHKLSEQAGIQRSIYQFYNNWVNWDKDCSLSEAIDNFSSADQLRKLSKAIILGSVLVQRCDANKKIELARAKKILAILTQPNYQFILENYKRIYLNKKAKKVGENFRKLLKLSGVDIETLTMQQKISTSRHTNNDMVKMTTALHVACLTGKLEAVKYLVEKLGIDVNYQDRTGSTPLMYAAWKGYFDVVEYLVAKGADVGISNSKKGTAIRYAAYTHRKKIVKFLKGKNGK